jgi:hypothetical protein
MASGTGPFTQAFRGTHETRAFYSGARQDYDQGIVKVIKDDFFFRPDYVTTTADMTATTAVKNAAWLILFDGAGTSQGITIEDTAGGVLKLASDSTATSKGAAITNYSEIFKPTASKTAWVKAKVALEDVDKSTFFFGLAKRPGTFTTSGHPVAAANPKIGFGSMTASSTSLSWISSATGTSSATCTTLADYVATTGVGFVTLGLRVNGTSSVDFFLDDKFVTSVTTAANIPSEELALFLVHGNATSGAATTQSLFCDYIDVDVTK